MSALICSKACVSTLRLLGRGCAFLICSMQLFRSMIAIVSIYTSLYKIMCDLYSISKVVEPRRMLSKILKISIALIR